MRPDLSAGVSMAQRHQNSHTVVDLIETNRLIKLAKKHADYGLEFPKLDGDICLITYHDASWANADEPQGRRRLRLRPRLREAGCCEPAKHLTN